MNRSRMLRVAMGVALIGLVFGGQAFAQGGLMDWLSELSGPSHIMQGFQVDHRLGKALRYDDQTLARLRERSAAGDRDIQRLYPDNALDDLKVEDRVTRWWFVSSGPALRLAAAWSVSTLSVPDGSGDIDTQQLELGYVHSFRFKGSGRENTGPDLRHDKVKATQKGTSAPSFLRTKLEAEAGYINYRFAGSDFENFRRKAYFAGAAAVLAAGDRGWRVSVGPRFSYFPEQIEQADFVPGVEHTGGSEWNLSIRGMIHLN